MDTLNYDLENLPRYKFFARWFLRICVLAHLYLIYLKRLITWELTSDYFLLSIIYLILAFILFAGGFYKRSTITKIAAIAMLVLTFVYFVTTIILGKNLYEMVTSNILLVGVLFYFATSSNWKENRYRRKDKKDKLLDKNDDNEDSDY
jgi:L-lactate permease